MKRKRRLLCILSGLCLLALTIWLLRPRPVTPFVGDVPQGLRYVGADSFGGKPLLDFAMPFVGHVRLPDVAIKPKDFDSKTMMGVIYVQRPGQSWSNSPRWQFEGNVEAPVRLLDDGGIACPLVYGRNPVTATLTAFGKSFAVRLSPTGSQPPARQAANLPFLPPGTQVRIVPQWDGAPSLPVLCEAKLVKGGPAFLGVTRSDADPMQGVIDQHVPLSGEQPVASVWLDLHPETTDQLLVQIPDVKALKGVVSWTTPSEGSSFPLLGSTKHNLTVKDVGGKVLGFGFVFTERGETYLEESAYYPPGVSLNMVRFKIGSAIFGYGLTGDLVPSHDYIPQPYRVKMPSIANGNPIQFQILSEWDQLTIDLEPLMR